MNILIPDSWLREYIETDLSPEDLAREGSLHGPSFERIELIEGEPVYDIEVTTNRVDSLAIKGIARELKAIIGERIKSKKLTEMSDWQPQLQTEELPLPIITVKSAEVKRIVCLVLDRVANQPSPEWIQRRLRQIGQNTHGIIIDVTNYVTHELGHPCHAFDYDKVMALGGQIVVKNASAGKKFMTLDGQEHQTVGGEVVFENEKGEIIDLPAIKGTANTAISEETTRVLFWLENMEATVVRRASMNHAIRTVAAIMNEKNVDAALMDEVLALGTQMLQQEAGAKIASKVFDYRQPRPEYERIIKLDLLRLDDYLGIRIDREQVKTILQDLGFAIKMEDKTHLYVDPPTYREHDVTIEADLIEEVARIYGYHRLPSKTDFPAVDIAKQPGVYFDLESKLKHWLAANGLIEVYTYSMVAPEMIEGDEAEYLRLANPLSEDRVLMRQSLVPSLLEVYRNNQGKTDDIKGIFEVANGYYPGENKGTVKEVMWLTILTTLPYRQARSLLEQLLALPYLEVEIDQNGIIRSGETQVGRVSLPETGKIAFELQVAQIGQLMREFPLIGPLGKGPIIFEDMTFVIKNQEIGGLIKQMYQASSLIKKIKLKDIYQDHYTFNYTYQNGDEALASEELAPVREAVVTKMAAHGCALVGELV